MRSRACVDCVWNESHAGESEKSENRGRGSSNQLRQGSMQYDRVGRRQGRSASYRQRDGEQASRYLYCRGAPRGPQQGLSALPPPRKHRERERSLPSAILLSGVRPSLSEQLYHACSAAQRCSMNRLRPVRNLQAISSRQQGSTKESWHPQLRGSRRTLPLWPFSAHTIRLVTVGLLCETVGCLCKAGRGRKVRGKGGEGAGCRR